MIGRFDTSTVIKRVIRVALWLGAGAVWWKVLGLWEVHVAIGASIGFQNFQRTLF